MIRFRGSDHEIGITVAAPRDTFAPLDGFAAQGRPPHINYAERYLKARKRFEHGGRPGHGGAHARGRGECSLV
jgi:hypothetical protein